MHSAPHSCPDAPRLAAAALCVSNLACQIICRELSLTRTLPFRSPEQLERFYLSIPESKVRSWGAKLCGAAHCEGDVTIQQLQGGRDLGSLAKNNWLLHSSRASHRSGCSSALLPASYRQGKGEGTGTWLAPWQTGGYSLPPACLCPAFAEGRYSQGVRLAFGWRFPTAPLLQKRPALPKHLSHNWPHVNPALS